MTENETAVQKVQNDIKVWLCLNSLHFVSLYRVSLHHFRYEGPLIKSIWLTVVHSILFNMYL